MVDVPLESFSEACGLIGPLRVHLEGAELLEPGPIEVHRPFLVVGRNPGADITIDSPDVSRRHAYFQVVAGRRLLCRSLEPDRGPLARRRPARGLDRSRPGR